MDTNKKYFLKQELEIPSSLKGLEKGFTNQSVVKRLPDIAQQMYNYVNSSSQFTEDMKQQLKKLIESIPDGKIPDIRDGQKFEDDEFWIQYENDLNNKTWLEVDWIFTEAYFYRAVNIITKNLLPISQTQKFQDNNLDAFKNQKEGALLTIPQPTVKTLLDRSNKFNNDKELDSKHLEELIIGCLSGNQVDLSMWPGMEISEGNKKSMQLVVNHLNKVVPYLEEFKQNLHKKKKIVYFFDNAGLELFSDLCLIDYLLSKLPNLKIVAYLKPTPAFVSDATPFDFNFTLNYFKKIDQEFANRIEKFLEKQQLELKTSYFSVCPLPLWEAPQLFQKEITSADFTIFKGDLNYRKILGDKHWSYDEDFQKVTKYVNAKFLALRTCKSMVGIGVDKEFINKIQKLEPEWLSSGKYEFIQSNL